MYRGVVGSNVPWRVVEEAAGSVTEPFYHEKMRKECKK